MHIGFLLAAAWLAGMQEQGARLEKLQQWEQAAAVYRSALDNLGSEGAVADRFWLQTSLAEMAFERRDYRDARRWLGQAEATLAGSPGAPERVKLLNAWGTLHLVEGNATAAERSLARAVELAASAADRAAALHNLAAVEMQTGRLREAKVHENEALELWRQQFGERHHYVMKAWIGLSSIEGLAGDWRAAEGSIQKALAISETPEALANYAVVLEKLHRGKEARNLRRKFRLDVPAASPVVDVKSLAEDKKLDVRSR